MYDLVDRPVTLLCPGSRLILWATRGWTRALTDRCCPPGSLAPAFLRAGVIEALPDFHRLMSLLNMRAVERIAVNDRSVPLVGEWEAILLRLWQDAANLPSSSYAMLDLILHDEAVGPGFQALLSVSGLLTRRGLKPVGLAQMRSADRP